MSLIDDVKEHVGRVGAVGEVADLAMVVTTHLAFAEWVGDQRVPATRGTQLFEPLARLLRRAPSSDYLHANVTVPSSAASSVRRRTSLPSARITKTSVAGCPSSPRAISSLKPPRALEAGEPEHVIEAVTGHLSRRMLEHYSHQRLKAKGQMLERMEERRKTKKA